MMFFRSKETKVQRRAHAILRQLDKDIIIVKNKLKDALENNLIVCKELRAYLDGDFRAYLYQFEGVGADVQQLIKELQQLKRERKRFHRVVNG